MKDSDRSKLVAACLTMAVLAVGFPSRSGADLPFDLTPYANRPGHMGFGDFDGNGYEDIVLSQSGIAVHFFDAKGRRRQAVRTSEAPDVGRFVLAAADLDDDSFCDLIVANTGAGIEIFSGSAKGLGPRPDRSLPLPTTELVRAVTIADVNGDGHRDILVATAGPNVLARGSATGFDSVQLAFNDFGAQDSHALLVFDADGNGAQDVLVGNEGANELYLAEPNGEFRTASRAEFNSGGSDTIEFLEADDVDGDGVLDVIVGTSGVYLGAGGGIFTAAVALAQSYYGAPAAAPALSGSGLFLLACAILAITIIRLRRRSA